MDVTRSISVMGVILLTFAFGCARDTGGKSKIRIGTPSNNSQKISQAVGAAFPAGQKVCYGVNISAPDLESRPANQCGPREGMMLGFVEGGQTIEADVPKGPNRKIELFAYLFPAGDTGPCPSFSSFLNVDLLKVYKAGEVASIDLVDSVHEVTIYANYPGAGQTFNVVYNSADSCLGATSVALPGFHFTSGGGELVSTGAGNYVVDGKIGRPADSKVLSGTNYIIDKE